MLLGSGRSSRPTRSRRPPSAPARRSPRSTGSAAPQPAIAGPTVDFTNFFSNRGVLVGTADPAEQAGAARVRRHLPGRGARACGRLDQRARRRPSRGPPQQTTLDASPSTFAAAEPEPHLQRLLLRQRRRRRGRLRPRRRSPHRSARTRRGAVGRTSAVGDFEDVKLTGADGLIGARAGQTAGFYVKLISLAPDGSQFKLYFTSRRARRSRRCNALPAGGPAGRLEKYIADNFPTMAAGDFAPLEAGVIDEDTYVEQGRDLERTYSLARHQLHPRHAPARHRPRDGRLPVHRRGLAPVPGRCCRRPTSDGNPNPYFDDLDATTQCPGRPPVADPRGIHPQRLPRRRREARRSAASLMGGEPDDVRRLRPRLRAAVVRGQRRRRSLRRRSGIAARRAASSQLPRRAGRRRRDDIAKAAGPAARSRSTSTWPAASRRRPTASAAELRRGPNGDRRRLPEPDRPGATRAQQVVAQDHEQGGAAQRRRHRLAAPEPQRRRRRRAPAAVPVRRGDAGPARSRSRSSSASTATCRTWSTSTHNINMHGDVRRGRTRHQAQRTPVADLRAIDIAPTLAFLMGIPGPQNARGRILYEIVEGGDDLKEVTILDISDYHGQLVPLAEAADNLVGDGLSTRPSRSAARRSSSSGSTSTGAEAARTASIDDRRRRLVRRRDAADLGLLRRQADDRDHEHDGHRHRRPRQPQLRPGSGYLRNELIPLADFPYVSANVVDPNGQDAGRVVARRTSSTSSAACKVGFVGFTNEDTPELVFPG